VRRAADGERELVNLNWGFVLLQKDRAPRRVTNVRDDKILTSLSGVRCLVPASSYCEPKGVKPATWHWFALDGDEERPLFAPGVWTRYRGPLKWRDKEAWTRAPSTASPTWAASRRTARSTSMPITSGARVLRDKQQMRYCGRFIVCRVPR
jgi:putative SOS response-associated peptidase YedK